jgi:hypothetical protein
MIDRDALGECLTFRDRVLVLKLLQTADPELRRPTPADAPKRWEPIPARRRVASVIAAVALPVDP